MSNLHASNSRYASIVLCSITKFYHQPVLNSTFPLSGPEMPTLHPTVTSILDNSHPAASSDDEDALLDSLDNDPALSQFREQRLQQLHSEFSRAKHMRKQEYGTYTTIVEEKALMDLTTSVKWCVVHFFKPDFARCGVMDEHLEVCFSPWLPHT